jgi:hypothetical protein
MASIAAAASGAARGQLQRSHRSGVCAVGRRRWGALRERASRREERLHSSAYLLLQRRRSARPGASHHGKGGGWTPTLLAWARSGHSDVLHVLVKAKADVDLTSHGHLRPNARLRRRRFLRSHRLQPTCCRCSCRPRWTWTSTVRTNPGVIDPGETPAHFAAVRGHTDALQLLAQAKADMDKVSTGPPAKRLLVLPLNKAAPTGCVCSCRARQT